MEGHSYSSTSHTAAAGAQSSSAKGRFNLLQYAKNQTEPMFRLFSEEGFFVGSDAYRCCYQHQNVDLRLALEVSAFESLVVMTFFGASGPSSVQ